MSLIKAIRAQFGMSGTATNNFTLDASAADGSMKLARGNAGVTTQDVLSVAADGKVDFPAGLAAFLGANQSLAANGYQKLPGGLIVQWGVIPAISSGAAQAVTFPITFPNTTFLVIGQPGGNNFSTSPAALTANIVSASQATFYNWGTNASLIGTYLAIGR